MLLVQAGSGVATMGLPDSPGVPAETTGNTLIAPYNDAGAVDALFQTYPNEIAAVIVEPIAANMGLVPPLPGFLEELRRLTQAYGAVRYCQLVYCFLSSSPGFLSSWRSKQAKKKSGQRENLLSGKGKES